VNSTVQKKYENYRNNRCNYILALLKKTLSALETLLSSAGRAGNTIIYIPIRQVALSVYFQFEGCNFVTLGQITEKGNRLQI